MTTKVKDKVNTFSSREWADILWYTGRLDISTPERMFAFQQWKKDDGSVKGIKKLYEKQIAGKV